MTPRALIQRALAIVGSSCALAMPAKSVMYTTRLPAGPALTGYGGSLAVVPQGVVPARRSTWGVLKTIYR